MTDGLDVVAVGVSHEGPVIVGVVPGPELRLVQALGSRPDGRRVERPNGRPVGRSEGDVGLTEAVAVPRFPNPKVGIRRYSIADGVCSVRPEEGPAEPG